MAAKLSISIAALVFASTALVACGGAEEAEAPAPDVTEVVEETVDAVEEVVEVAEAPLTIVGLAAGNEDLSTLVAAVTAADLVDTLNGDGPFTVFAPPNSAFAKLPAGTVESLVQPEAKDTLTGILTYHVVSGKVMAADLVAAISAEEDGVFDITTVNGATLSASIVDGAPVLTDTAGNTSNITATDIGASNGVVHLIDTVVMPG